MVVGHFHVMLLKRLPDPLHQRIIHGPIVAAVRPYPDHVVDGAGLIGVDPNDGGRVGLDLGDGVHHRLESLFDGLGGGVVGGGEGQIDPPSLGVVGEVDDLAEDIWLLGTLMRLPSKAVSRV